MLRNVIFGAALGMLVVVILVGFGYLVVEIAEQGWGYQSVAVVAAVGTVVAGAYLGYTYGRQ